MSNDYTKKCSHILLAYIVWMIAAMVLFCALRWLFWTKLAMPWPDGVWTLGFPLLLGGLIAFVAMRRRLKIIPENNWRRDCIPSMVMFTTSILTLTSVNTYMKISSPTTAVDEVTEIKAAPNEIYYTINHFTLRKDVLKGSICYNHSRRKNVRIECFFVMPFEDSELNYWYGVKYTHPNTFLSNENELDKEADAFYKSCLSQFQSNAPQSAVRFEKITASDDLNSYRSAIALAVGPLEAERSIILQPIPPQDEPDVQSRFYWIFGAFAIGLILLLILLASTNLDKLEYERQIKPQ